MGSPSKKNGEISDATIGLEAKLWQTSNNLRQNMDAAEHNHVLLGLISVKHISDSVVEIYAKLSVEPTQNTPHHRGALRRTTSPQIRATHCSRSNSLS